MRSTRGVPWRGWLLAAFLTITATTTMAAEMTTDATYWRRQEEGWFWYRDHK